MFSLGETVWAWSGDQQLDCWGTNQTDPPDKGQTYPNLQLVIIYSETQKTY